MKVWKTIRKCLIFIAVAIFLLIVVSLIPLGWIEEGEGLEQEIPSGLILESISQVSTTYWNSDIEINILKSEEQFEFLQSILGYKSVHLLALSMESAEETTVDLTLELSVESMDDFLSHLSSLGQVEAIQTYTNNEALVNQNVEAWILNLSIQEQRYQELLKESTDLDQLLNIEKELSRIREELDQWQLLKKQSEQSIKMTTAHLNVRLISDDNSWKGLIAEELKIQMTRISQISKHLIAKLIGLIPYLLMIAFLVLIGYGVFKRRKR